MRMMMTMKRCRIVSSHHRALLLVRGCDARSRSITWRNAIWNWLMRMTRLQSFTHEGHHISSFDCGIERPSDVAFDEHRGLIAFSVDHRVHVIGANQWLADTFTWRPDLHRYAPSWMKQAVSTMTMIRSLVDDCSAMSMIPNELLFEIFSFI